MVRITTWQWSIAVLPVRNNTHKGLCCRPFHVRAQPAAVQASVGFMQGILFGNDQIAFGKGPDPLRHRKFRHGCAFLFLDPFDMLEQGFRNVPFSQGLRHRRHFLPAEIQVHRASGTPSAPATMQTPGFAFPATTAAAEHPAKPHPPQLAPARHSSTWAMRGSSYT